MSPWLFTAAVHAGALLLVAAAIWLVVRVVLRVPLISITLAVTLLLTALVSPTASRMRAVGMPAALAAAVSLAVLVGVPAGIMFLIWTQVSGRFSELVASVTDAIDEIREYLITGPLSLDQEQVDRIRNQVVAYIEKAIPEPAVATQMVLQFATASVLVAFTVFFLLKDGRSMWAWALERTPAHRRSRLDGAGRRAWLTLTHYMAGTTVIAILDAVLIGVGLLVVGVPLWIPLTLLVFLGGFVPLLGATVSGAVAVLVTLVTAGFTDALIVLAVVLVVQQVEGNLLQPLLMGRAVNLHPVVTLLSVTTGTLLLGIAGALVAVPVVAVAYRTAEYLRTHPTAQDSSAPSESDHELKE